jgi:hypothetical protein
MVKSTRNSNGTSSTRGSIAPPIAANSLFHGAEVLPVKRIEKVRSSARTEARLLTDSAFEGAAVIQTTVATKSDN